MVRIAVVDDDQDLLDLMAAVLQEHGWEMLGIADGAIAVPCLRTELPDAVLLDLRLGGPQTGWDILADLRTHPRTRSIPVIVCSAAFRQREVIPPTLAGQDIPLLPKPLEIEELYHLLEEVLRDPDGERARRIASAG